MLLRLDELNSLKGKFERYKGNVNELVGLFTDWLFLAYADGKTDVEDMLGKETEVSVDNVMDVVSAKVGGENVFERVADDIYLEDVEALLRLADNERSRVYNTAAYDTATKLGAKYKVWHTMEDDRVRDTHDYIDRMKKPIGEAFYTYTGDYAMYPQGFQDAENNIGCRCWLTYE